ncbi:MAG: TonB-dependent receptor [Bacteroidales bacterium]
MISKKVITTSVIALFSLMLNIVPALGQNGIIRGFVYEKESGEPVIFTNVFLLKTSYGASTDVNGYFTISRVPDGSYTLIVKDLGYDTLRQAVTIKGSSLVSLKLYLKKASYELKGINVSAERDVVRTETRTSVAKITPKQIKQIPSIGGQPDLAQYLQVLPGVIFTGDQGGQLYIRGGSPIQNKVLLDGMIIYNPFHSIGLFSVFDTDILRNADVYTGGFGAEYGGRISSVMDLTTRDGNKKRLAGKAGASTFGAKILVEGPLKKETESGSGSSSFILSLKNSYLEQSSKTLYKYIDTLGLPFNYTDVYGKISMNAANGSKVNFFGFNYDDKVHYRALSDYHWDAAGGGMNFVVIPGSNPVLMEGNFAYSSYNISLAENNSQPRTSKINGFNLGLGFTYYLGKDEMKYGVEMLGFKTVFNFYNALNLIIDQTQNTTELAGYVKYKMTKGKFLIEPGFRMQWYASLSDFSPEPRLALKYNVSDKVRIKLAAGLYSQNLLAANSDRDVVNLFYGFLSGPDNLQDEFNGKIRKHSLQKSQHIILGFEFDPIENVTVNLEGYYKNFPQLTVLNRNKVFNDAPPYNDPSPNNPYFKEDYLRKDYIIESGDAEGIDLSLKYEHNHIYFWAVYSYAFVHRFDGQVNYAPHYDRRHNVNVVASYQFGEKYLWDFNVRWNMGSGFPFTKTQGFYEKLLFNQGIYSDPATMSGELGIIYDDLNKGRLPYYHRLDFSITRRILLSEHSTLECNLSITNVYNRENIFYVDRVTAEHVNQLPFMPSAGLTLSF